MWQHFRLRLSRMKFIIKSDSEGPCWTVRQPRDWFIRLSVNHFSIWILGNEGSKLVRSPLLVCEHVTYQMWHPDLSGVESFPTCRVIRINAMEWFIFLSARWLWSGLQDGATLLGALEQNCFCFTKSTLFSDELDLQSRDNSKSLRFTGR